MKFKKNIKNNPVKSLVLYAIIAIMGFCLSSVVHAASEDNIHLDITLLNQDPDPAEQGEYLELRWKVIKSGNSNAEDLKFSLDIDYPFSFDLGESAEKSLGDWIGKSKQDEHYVLHYKLRVDDDALEDTYQVKLKWKTSNNAGWVEEEFNIRIGEEIKPEFVLGTLTTSPVKLLADTEENKLEITLENIGDENAETVRMDLELPDGFSATYGYSTRSNLGTISAGGSAEATLYIDLDEGVKEGRYEANVNINYKEANDEDNKYKTVKLPLEIPVNGKPMFSIENFKSDPDKINPGSEVELLVILKNTGTKEAESVSITAFKESSQPFEFDEKSDFIGRLKPGEAGEAILKFNVENDANTKKYLLDIQARCIYNDEVITENEIVSINVEKSQRSDADYGIGLAVIIGIAGIGSAGFYLFNKRKKK